MPDDLQQLAQNADHQDRWGMPRWGNDLQALASQQQMTHQAEQPNPAAPWLERIKEFGRQTFVDPLQATGFLPQQQTPPWYNTAKQLGGTLNPPPDNSWLSYLAHGLSEVGSLSGGLPLIEAWTPAEISLLKRAYSSGNYNPSSLLPGRTPTGILQKAYQLGLKRPGKPEYVRQPGSPMMAGNQEKFDQLIMMMSRQNMTVPQMAERLQVSERTLRRYLNENLKVRMRAQDIWNDQKRMNAYKDMVARGLSQRQMAETLGTNTGTVTRQLDLLNRAGIIKYVPGGGTRTPSMPRFSFQDEVLQGDPDYERTLLEYLRSRQ